MSKSPAFQFYPNDFLGDAKQAVMELDESGAYVRLMCHCWTEGHIPDDVVKLAKLAGTDRERMAQLWPAIAPCFLPDPAFKGYLIHPRLDKERAKQARHREKVSDRAKKGAAARWGKDAQGIPEAMLTDAPSVGFSASAVPAVVSSASAVSAHSGGEAGTLPTIEELVAYVGEPNRFAVVACAAMRGLSPAWPMVMLGSYGPGPKTDPNVERIPEAERPAVLALAMQRYAVDAKDWSSPLFRSFIAKAWAHRQKGEAENADVGRTVARAATFVPVIEERRRAAPPIEGEPDEIVKQLAQKFGPGISA